MRLDAFFGSPNTSPPPSRTRCSWRLTRRVFASNVYVRPPEPQRLSHPQTHGEGDDVQRLEPVALSGCEECARLLRVERRDLVLPHLRRSTRAAGLNGIRLNLTACSSARCSTAYMYRTLEGFNPSRSFAA